MNNNLRYQLGLIGFTRLSNILRLWHYTPAIHPRYFLRLILVVTSSICSQPLRWWETWQYGRKIAQTNLEKSPIFIIGHWRSGTTHLHNLLIQDPSFGYVSMYQAIVPECSLVGQPWLKELLGKIIPEKRPMDNMIWPLNGPQEEEVPLAKMIPYGFYVSFLFPSQTRYLFQKYVLMVGTSPQIIAEFKQNYLKILQIATIHARGQQLILKNPVNTARIRLLLELFPDAKFIHIYRSPYDLFASSQNLQRKLLTLTTLQKLDYERGKETILVLYEQMMQQFFRDRSLIPTNHLVEIRYEDLEQNPLQELQKIYDQLNLPGYPQVLPAFQEYLTSVQSYRKNSHNLSTEDRQLIESRWSFAFQELGYEIHS